MEKKYEHLSIEERALIQAKLETGCTLRAIAHGVQRSPSTISREIKRNGWRRPETASPVRLRTRGINGYWCEAAQKRACQAGWQWARHRRVCR